MAAMKLMGSGCGKEGRQSPGFRRCRLLMASEKNADADAREQPLFVVLNAGAVVAAGGGGTVNAVA